MAAVMVELMPRPAETGIPVDRIELVDDLDVLTESNKRASHLTTTRTDPIRATTEEAPTSLASGLLPRVGRE